MRNIYYIVLLSLCSLSWSLFAQELTVKSLSNGACWVEKSEQVTKIANFNQNTTFTLGSMEVGDAIDTIIHKFSSEYGHQLLANKLEIFLHCGTYGASLVFHFSGKHNLCVWSSFSQGQLKVGFLNAAHANQHGFCDGIVPGVFLVKVKNMSKLKATLQTTYWNSRLDKLELLSGDVYKLYIKRNFYFQEDDIFTQLSSLSSLSFVDFNGMNHSIGETLPLYRFDL